MTDDATKMLPGAYVVGIPITGTSFAALHMTIAYVGEIPESGLRAMQEDLRRLADAVLPLRLVYGKNAMLGENMDIPVRLIDIPDQEKKALLDQFFDKHYQVEPGRTRYPSQTFHVSTKKLQPDEASALGEHVATSLFLKQLGSAEYLLKLSSSK